MTIWCLYFKENHEISKAIFEGELEKDGKRCIPCGIPLNSEQQILDHIRGNKHKKKSSALKSNACTNVPIGKTVVMDNIQVSSSVY